MTARMAALTQRSQQHTCQLIAIGGVDYFKQENDFVSPPELEYEPNDGQPGTVVLSKSSNLNLNLALNGNYTYTPGVGELPVPPPRPACSTRTAVSTPPGSLGRTLLAGQENPDQTASLSVLQDDRAGPGPRRLRARRSCC